jgi:hypothetical protein
VALRYDGLAIGAVRIHGVNKTGVQLKHKKARNEGAGTSVSFLGQDGFRHAAPVLQLVSP